MFAKTEEINKNAGLKWIIGCNTRWADEGVMYWSVAEYPVIETYQKKVGEFEKLDRWRYMSAKTILGTKA